jgi:hypothetical protein
MDDERHRWIWRLIGLGGGALFSAAVWAGVWYLLFGR